MGAQRPPNGGFGPYLGGPGAHVGVLFGPLGAPGVPTCTSRGPKNGLGQKWSRKWTHFGSIFGVFLASFFDNFSDVLFEGLLALIWVNFGGALDPNGTSKSKKNVER